MSSRLIVLIASLVFAVLFGAGGWFVLDQHENRFHFQLESEAAQLQGVYEATNRSLAYSAQALAFGLVSDLDIQHLMDEANQTVRREGGGTGGIKAEILRDQLRYKMLPQWQSLSAQYSVSSMTFMLPDNADVFLRMHEPEEFGDSLAAIRPFGEIKNDLLPRSGFQIGYTNAGIRAAVPILRPATDGGTIHVGTLELGLNMSDESRFLSDQLTTGIAVLLDTQLVVNTMKERYLPAHALHPGCCALLVSTRPEGVAWYESDFVKLTPVAESKLLSWEGHTFHTIAFPLRDWQGQADPEYPPVGTILIWRDATARVNAYSADRHLIVNGFIVTYLLVLACIPMVLRLLHLEWGRQIKEHGAMINALARHNDLLIETIGEGVYGLDREGKITFINRAACSMLGLDNTDVIGKEPHPLFHHHKADGQPNPVESCPLMKAALDGQPWEGEEWLIHRDGHGFPALITVSPIYSHGIHEGAVTVFRNIAQLRNRQDELTRLAITDSLTGIPNRRYFLELFESELARLRRHSTVASLLMTDLDFFKRVNDHYGHAVGDLVLKRYVSVARSALRRTDIIGRLGGEEFAILLPGDGINGANELAERLRQLVESSPVRVDDTYVQITVSIGITELYPQDVSTDAPLRRSDEALYAAKQAGRNRTEIYSSQWDESTVRGGASS
jgi:diguanylate cyclase (GGDEF)-like protein/PAS domain S-box-containing protein